MNFIIYSTNFIIYRTFIAETIVLQIMKVCYNVQNHHDGSAMEVLW